MSVNKIRIKSVKYDGQVHYEWSSEIVDKNKEYIVVQSKPGRELVHHSRGEIFTFDNPAIEIFSFRDWYTVSANFNENKVESYYCNICKPAQLKNGILSFLDLDLDLVKRKNEDWKVVDEDEFLENMQIYGYPEQLVKRIRRELNNLQDKLEKGEFPFNGIID
ncbi:MAG: DUF402 domain-containing protein, partial [Halanaerobiales bacterium]